MKVPIIEKEIKKPKVAINKKSTVKKFPITGLVNTHKMLKLEYENFDSL